MQVELALCGINGGLLAKSHQKKVQGREGWVEILQNERRIWGWPLESYKKGMRLLRKQSGILCG